MSKKLLPLALRKLRSKMVLRGIKREDIEDGTGIHKTTISKVLNGTRKDDKSLRRIRAFIHDEAFACRETCSA